MDLWLFVGAMVSVARTPACGAGVEEKEVLRELQLLEIAVGAALMDRVEWREDVRLADAA